MSVISIVSIEENGRHRLLSLLGRILSRGLDEHEEEFKQFCRDAVPQRNNYTPSLEYAWWFHVYTRKIKSNIPSIDRCTKHEELVVMHEPQIPYTLIAAPARRQRRKLPMRAVAVADAVVICMDPVSLARPFKLFPYLAALRAQYLATANDPVRFIFLVAPSVNDERPVTQSEFSDVESLIRKTMKNVAPTTNNVIVMPVDFETGENITFVRTDAPTPYYCGPPLIEILRNVPKLNLKPVVRADG